MEADPINAEGIAANARAESLGAEITELCACSYALEARFLDLLREFDAGKSWERLGFHSCAHWMNLKCSMGLHAARERLRVAHALANLPKMARAFAEGRLSYSKVRAMTRVADSTNEDYLLMIAKHGTAWHVETLVRKTRRVIRLREAARTDEPHRLRSLQCHYDEDGMLVLKARLPAEQGALVVAALERAMEQAEAEGVTANIPPPALQWQVSQEFPHVPAGTSATAREPRSEQIREPRHARRADGLVQLAESYLAETAHGGSSAERYRVVVHVSAETLQGHADVANTDDLTVSDVPAGTSHLEHGPHVPAGTSRRLACDASLVALLEDAEGIPLSVGRQTRSIPPWLRRALQARDGGCRFPGCTHTRFVDGHHIQHWADGGETSLDNLVLLCRYHHRLVHEGGFHCERSISGEVVFTSPAEERLAPYDELPGMDTGEDPIAWLERHADTAHIDATTCVTQWYAGDRMDWNLAVGHMFAHEQQAASHRSADIRRE